jgi:hypothetical protein
VLSTYLLLVRHSSSVSPSPEGIIKDVIGALRVVIVITTIRARA